MLGLPPISNSALSNAVSRTSTSDMCTVLHAIVAAALPLLAGSSAPAVLQETGPRRGTAVGLAVSCGGRMGSADRRGALPDAVFLERSRLVCSHWARPRSARPGASKPVRSDGPQWAHLFDREERNSQTKACIVYHVHLSLRHRHRRAFPPRRFVSPGSAPLHAWASWRAGSYGDRAGLVRSVGRAWDAPRPRVLSHRSCGVQISAQLAGWSMR